MAINVMEGLKGAASRRHRRIGSLVFRKVSFYKPPASSVLACRTTKALGEDTRANGLTDNKPSCYFSIIKQPIV